MATRRRRLDAADAPRFVIQQHHASHLHWDFRLERDGVLVSWALPKGVPLTPDHDELAIHVEDHSLSYFGFEGDIPAGSYGAGHVEQWDRGTYECHEFRDGKVEVTLHGRRIAGRYALFRTGRERGRDEWMIHRMDPPPDGWEPLPQTIAPMMAQLAQLPDDDDGWAWEVKWDGIRALAFVAGGRVRLQSRNLLDITAAYPELRELGEQLGARQAVLDGEIVAIDEHGVPNFERLQQRMAVREPRLLERRMRQVPVTYMIFDLLHLEGRSLVRLPWRERRELLESLELGGAAWRVPSYTMGHGAELLRATREQGLEGLVGKRPDARYQAGRRTGAWRKVKNQLREEFVVCGYLPGKRGGEAYAARILVAYHRRDRRSGRRELVYAGTVRTGFTDQQRRDLHALLEPLAVPAGRSPLDVGAPSDRAAVLVRPEMVCEVEFHEWTKAGRLRHATWRGLRGDIPAAAVVREVLEGDGDATGALGSAAAAPHDAELDRALALRELAERGVSLSHPERVLFPQVGMTKADVFAWLLDIAPTALPHVRERAFTLKRFPEGVEGPHFFEKRAPAHRPEWIETVAQFSKRSGNDVNFVLLNDLPAIVWAANLGAWEWHVFLSDAADLATPLVVAFDLDPGEGATMADCCSVGLWLRELLSAAGLEAWPKTSGSKGLHVYVPLNQPGIRFGQSRAFAQAVARLLEQQHPERVTSAMAKARRRGKVFIDWSQNEDFKTTVAPYSLRARSLPGVSTPLTWEEVEEGVQSAAAADALLAMTPADVLARVAAHGDLFAPVLTTRQHLPGT